jgi:hypothetical protein
MIFHHILLSGGGGGMFKFWAGQNQRGFDLIHLKPPPPILILVNHVPIVILMGMMCIIVFPYIQNYNKINHKLLLLGKM